MRSFSTIFGSEGKDKPDPSSAMRIQDDKAGEDDDTTSADESAQTQSGEPLLGTDDPNQNVDGPEPAS